MASERDAAVRRLDAALVERQRLTEDRRAAIGTPDEIGADARLWVTREEVAALQDWLDDPSEDRATTGAGSG